MILYGKTVKNVAMLLLSATIAACGGGSGGGSEPPPVGGSSSSDPGSASSSSSSDSISSSSRSSSSDSNNNLSGLNGDADNQDLLYFSHSYETGENPDTGQTQYRSTLYAIDPATPDIATALPLDTQQSAQGDDMGRTHYTSLYEADIDPNDGSVTHYRVADVLFLHNRHEGDETSEGFARVSTAVATTPEAVRVSSETYLGAAVTGAGTLVRQNYADSDHAAVVYGLPGIEARIRMTFGSGEARGSSGNGTLYHIAAMEENDSPDRQSYLVLSSYGGTQCSDGYRLSRDIMALDGSPILANSNLLPGNREAKSAAPLGGPLSDGHQYLVVETLVDTGVVGRPCVSEGASLWRYDTSQPFDEVVQVLDENNDPLIFPEGIAGPMMPATRHIAHQGGVLYFGIGNSLTEPQDLYRVEDDNWSVLAESEEPLGADTGFVITGDGRVAASVGNTVVSWAADGGDRQELDSSDAAWLGIQTEVLGSRDGWIFYNRPDAIGRDYAVAMKIDGSDSMEIVDAQWIGASLSGNGEAIRYMTELSEVFLWNNEREIAAVSAADPKAGKVVLGELDNAPENVAMYGLAPGPHRLIQVHLDTDNSEVYYVNTREENSLRKSLDEAEGNQRPVQGF